MKNKISYYLEKKALIDYFIMKTNKKTRKMAIPFFVYCMIVSLLILFVVLTGGKTDYYWYIAMIIIIIADAMGLLLIAKPDLRTKRMKKESERELKYFSQEEYYEIEVKNTECCVRKTKYEKIYSINEIKWAEVFENCVFIFLTPKRVIILDKDGFVNGSWKECEEMLQKNGVEVRTV